MKVAASILCREVTEPILNILHNSGKNEVAGISTTQLRRSRSHLSAFSVSRRCNGSQPKGGHAGPQE